MGRRNSRHVIGNIVKSQPTNITYALIKEMMTRVGMKIVLDKINQIEDPGLRNEAMKVFKTVWITK